MDSRSPTSVALNVAPASFDANLFEPATRPWQFAAHVRRNIEFFRDAHPGIQTWSFEAVAVAWDGFLAETGQHTNATLPPRYHGRFYAWLCAKLGQDAQSCIETEQPNARVCRTFEDSRSFARRLLLRCSEDWWMWCAGARPDLPARPAFVPLVPNKVYLSKWRGWADWLGTNASPAARAAADWSVQYERVNGRRPQIQQLDPTIQTLGSPDQAPVTWTVESIKQATRRLAKYAAHDER